MLCLVGIDGVSSQTRSNGIFAKLGHWRVEGVDGGQKRVGTRLCGCCNGRLVDYDGIVLGLESLERIGLEGGVHRGFEGVEIDFVGLREHVAVHSQFLILLEYLLLHRLQARFQLVLLDLESFDFSTLALARVVGGKAIAFDAFNTALLLLVGSLCTLTGREIGLGLWQDLAPALQTVSFSGLGLTGL